MSFVLQAKETGMYYAGTNHLLRATRWTDTITEAVKFGSKKEATDVARLLQTGRKPDVRAVA